MSDTVTGVVLYTDGSARRHGAGWGVHGYTFNDATVSKPSKGIKIAVPTKEGYAVKKDLEGDILQVIDVLDAYGSISGKGTNSTAELLALIRGVEEILVYPRLEYVLIYTDSKYVIDGLLKWLPKWKSKDWKTQQGEDVANKDLWLRLETAWEKLKLLVPSPNLKHIKGHAGDFGNESSDTMARLGSGNTDADYCKFTPYEEWVESFQYEKISNLLVRGRLLFNIGSERPRGLYHTYHLGGSSKGGDRKGESFDSVLRRSECNLGMWVPDNVFAVTRMKEPVALIERLIDAHCATFARDQIDMGVLNLQFLYVEKIGSEVVRHGVNGLVKYPREMALLSAHDDLVVRTIDPPVRMVDAVNEFARMERHLDQWIEKKDFPNRVTVDLTDRVYTTEKKSEKAKVQYKLTPEINPGPKSIDVMVPYADTELKVRLILGMDIPTRNALSGSAGESTRLHLLVYIEGGRYYHETVLETEDAITIFHSPQTQYVL